MEISFALYPLPLILSQGRRWREVYGSTECRKYSINGTSPGETPTYAAVIHSLSLCIYTCICHDSVYFSAFSVWMLEMQYTPNVATEYTTPIYPTYSVTPCVYRIPLLKSVVYDTVARDKMPDT